MRGTTDQDLSELRCKAVRSGLSCVFGGVILNSVVKSAFDRLATRRTD